MITIIIKRLITELNRLIYPSGKAKKIFIGNIPFVFNKLDMGGAEYDSRKSFEEASSQLFVLVKKDFNPTLVIDVGANYGFISVLAARAFPDAEIISIEPSAKLIPFINNNLKLNNVRNQRVIKAICGLKEMDNSTFSINPNSSQDNRVISPKRFWRVEKVPMISLNSLLKDFNTSGFVFIKIDVQGYEEQVFNGGEQFLINHKNWLIKTEFAPRWLESQGTNPKDFLKKLVQNYDVVESPSRIPYLTKSVNELFNNLIIESRVDEFVNYLQSLDRDNKGWSDLLIRPKHNPA